MSDNRDRHSPCPRKHLVHCLIRMNALLEFKAKFCGEAIKQWHLIGDLSLPLPTATVTPKCIYCSQPTIFPVPLGLMGAGWTSDLQSEDVGQDCLLTHPVTQPQCMLTLWQALVLVPDFNCVKIVFISNHRILEICVFLRIFLFPL